MGLGRKMEGSRLIRGGGTNLVVGEFADDMGEGFSGSVEVLAILEGTASRFAYRRSKRDREGDGIGIRTDRLDRADEGVSDLCASGLSVQARDNGVDDSCVVGVNAVLTVKRCKGERFVVSIVIDLLGRVEIVLQLSVSILLPVSWMILVFARGVEKVLRTKLRANSASFCKYTLLRK
jgi:hypothetical protein